MTLLEAAIEATDMPVIFRLEYDREDGRWVVLAILPAEPGPADNPCHVEIDYGRDLGGSTFSEYYSLMRRTRPATPAHYASLLAELRDYYESTLGGYKVRVVGRASRTIHERRRRAYA